MSLGQTNKCYYVDQRVQQIILKISKKRLRAKVFDECEGWCFSNDFNMYLLSVGCYKWVALSLCKGSFLGQRNSYYKPKTHARQETVSWTTKTGHVHLPNCSKNFPFKTTNLATLHCKRFPATCLFTGSWYVTQLNCLFCWLTLSQTFE